MDLDLRKLRYFAEVAEQLHFRAAAERLHITQPVLSRQISQLERELGVTLFTRSSRRVALTPAGRPLQEEARALLPAADAARDRVRDAERGERAFCAGFMAGITLTPVISDLSAAHPGVTVDLRRSEWHDQAEQVLDGTMDVGHVRLPITERGLRLRRLYAEPRFAVLARQPPPGRQGLPVIRTHPVCLASDETRHSSLITAFTRLAQAFIPPGAVPA